MPQGRNGGYAPNSSALHTAVVEELGNAKTYMDADTFFEERAEDEDLVVVSAGNFDQKAKDMIVALNARAQEQEVKLSFLWPASQANDADLAFARENNVSLVLSKGGIKEVSEAARAEFAPQMIMVNAVAAVGPVKSDSYAIWKEQAPQDAQRMLDGIAASGYLVVVQPVSYVSSNDKKTQVPVPAEEIRTEADHIARGAKDGAPVVIIAPDRDASDTTVALAEGASPATNPTTAQTKMLCDELSRLGVNYVFVNKPGLIGGPREDSIHPWNVVQGLLQEGKPGTLVAEMDAVAGTSFGVVERLAYEANIPLEVTLLKASNNSPSLEAKADELHNKYGVTLSLASGTITEMLDAAPVLVREPSNAHYDAAVHHIKRFGLNG